VREQSIERLMPPVRLRLKSGADAERAREVLHERIEAAHRITSAGVGSQHEAGHRIRMAYIEWAEATESVLQELTFDTDMTTALHTQRYWRIRQPGDPRPHPLVYAEVRQQVDWLSAVLKDLTQRVLRARVAGGHIAVLDTHVLLHYQPPEEIDWIEVAGTAPLRLVIPLRVIEEVDAKKYSGRDLADRARRLLPALRRKMGKAGAPGALREGVSIEVSVDPGPRWRPADADEEILNTCHELRQLSGQPVVLVTGDTGMTLRAEAEEIPVVSMPEKYLRNRTQGTGGRA